MLTSQRARLISRPERTRKALLLPLVAIAAVLLAPFLVLIAASFSANGLAGGFVPSLEQFMIAFNQVDLLRYTKNSLAVGVVYTVPVVISSFFAGYAFARLRVRGSGILFGVVVATMLVPLFVYIIPLFVLYSRLGLTNTVIPWLLWGIAGNAFYIFLFRQFFDAFPSELEEAAMMDGLTRWGIITRIVAPNSLTVIATVTILAFTSVWGEALVQGILLYTDEAQTLSARLASGVVDPAGRAILVAPTLAALVIYILPPIAVFVAFQRYIIAGVATTGLK